MSWKIMHLYPNTSPTSLHVYITDLETNSYPPVCQLGLAAQAVSRRFRAAPSRSACRPPRLRCATIALETGETSFCRTARRQHFRQVWFVAVRARRGAARPARRAVGQMVLEPVVGAAGWILSAPGEPRRAEPSRAAAQLSRHAAGDGRPTLQTTLRHWHAPRGAGRRSRAVSSRRGVSARSRRGVSALVSARARRRQRRAS